MKSKKSLKPTDSELAVLQVLWKQGASTVRAVNDELNKQRAVGYTTSLKIMQIMHEKGLLSRTRSGRTHVYHAVISESEIQKSLVDKLLEKAFHGSAMKLVMQALGNHSSTSEELSEIRKFLDQLEKK